MNKYLLIALILALLTALGLFYDRQHQKDEKIRYRSNYKVSQADLTTERTRNDEAMIKIGALELSNNDLKDSHEDVLDEMKNMGVKLNKLQAYTSTATKTVYNFETTFKDSTVNDTNKIEKLDYHTEWIDLEILKEGVNARVQIHTRDSLIQVVYWERSRKFLFFKWGRKMFSQKIRSANPDSEIKYSEFILPKRK